MDDACVQGGKTKNTQLQVFTSGGHPGSRLSLQPRSKKECFQLLYSKAACEGLVPASFPG